MRVLVQHHPARPLDRLLGSLDIEPEIVVDPEPDAKLRSPWRTYERCLQLLGTDEGIVLQDDAVACTGFLCAASAAVRARPGRLIAFFHGGTLAMRQAFARATGPFVEITGNSWVPVVALYWPAGAAAELLEYVEPIIPYRRQRRADDALVGEWARKSRRGALVTVPCLVEHPDDEPSLIGARHRAGSNRQRVAACYVGDGAIEWAEGLDLGQKSTMMS